MEEIKVKRGRGRPKKIVSDVKPKAVKAVPKLPILKIKSKDSCLYIQLLKTKNELYPLIIGTLHRSPTSNCQVFSIAEFNHTINNVKTKGGILHVLKTCSLHVGKRLCLVDLNLTEANKIRKLFKSQIILDSPYNSTNGSNMSLFLIKVWDSIDYSYTINIDKIQSEYK